MEPPSLQTNTAKEQLGSEDSSVYYFLREGRVTQHQNYEPSSYQICSKCIEMLFRVGNAYPIFLDFKDALCV